MAGEGRAAWLWFMAARGSETVAGRLPAAMPDSA